MWLSIKFTSLFMLLLLVLGCGNSEDKAVSGYHFQGRDCLSCHNNDLQPVLHQSLAGTVYKTFNAEIDDQESYCKGKLFVLISPDGTFAPTTTIDSRTFVSSNRAGFQAIGNIFLMEQDYNITGSEGIIRIVNELNQTVAQSGGVHQFTSSFDQDNPAAVTSRHSCNACHGSEAKGGTLGFIYENQGTPTVCQ